MTKDTAYMSLKEGRELAEIFAFMNSLSMNTIGAPCLVDDLNQLRERIRNYPDQFGNYRIVRVTAEVIGD